MKPLVSVVIPTYNSADHLTPTIESVMSQEGDFRLELIIADDCSSDNTYEIVQKYATVSVRNTYNSGGPNWGRNMGLYLAKGEYICFIDHDDIWFPGKVQQQLEAMQKYNTKICVTDLQIRSATGKIEPRGNVTGRLEYHEKDELFLRLLRRHKGRGALFYPGTVMIHGDLKDISFEERFGFCDYDYMLTVNRNQAAARVSKILVQRNESLGGLSFSDTYRLTDHYWGLMQVEQYYDAYPKDAGLGARRMYGTLARYYYFMGNMPRARRYLRYANLSWKNIAYYLTSYYGHKRVKKNYRIFG